LPDRTWSTPVNLGPAVNSAFHEQQPALSKDGRRLFFASNRPGGSGAIDIYVVERLEIPQ
jgi:Tol biopolymer transport system component